MPEPSQQLAPGDVVRLVGSDLQMTVDHVSESTIVVKWLGCNGLHNVASVQPHSLVKIRESAYSKLYKEVPLPAGSQPDAASPPTN